jgi:Fic family protein
MRNIKLDMQSDFLPDFDLGEKTTLMEPLVFSSDLRHRAMLTDLALDLVAKSAGLRRSLPEGVAKALAKLVRSMNCYYSNLIEGHYTHPIDIERTLRKDYSKDKEKRNLQLEAQAHMAVQQWIDEGGLRGTATKLAGILEIHKRFYELVPEDLLFVSYEGGKKKERIVPGELRKQNVQVGQYVAVSPGALPRFLEKFESTYSPLGKTETILAAAAAHHRLLWIHPFLDGNGRVARLVSYAQLLEALDTGGLWSVSRGLARNENTYKSCLIACDQPRRNDLDERGNLSEEALAGFTRFFIETCIDQVDFMESLIDPNRLRERILLWAEEEVRSDKLLPRSTTILQAILYSGELSRSEITKITGLGERQGRRVVATLIESGILTAKTDRAPLQLAFPAILAPRLFPGLFPDKVCD